MERAPRILELEDFRNLWIGQTISQLGDSVYFLVFLFMAQKVTGDPNVTGMIAIMQALPFVLFSPIAGVIVDRVDRRNLMVFAEWGSFGVMAVFFGFLLVEPQPQVWQLGGAAFVLATLTTFFLPARSAAIPRLVPKERLMEANGFAMATQQAVGLLGIAISAGVLGALYQFSPDNFFRLAVIANCLTFLASGWMMRKLPSIQAETAEGLAGLSFREFRSTVRTLWGEVLEGAREIRRDALVRVALPVNVLSTMSISGFFLVYVVVNDEWYGGQFWTLAVIELAFAAISLVCSVYVGRMRVRHPGLHFAWGIAVIGLLVVGMAFSKPYLLFLALNAACGFAFPSIVIPITSYFQTAFADEVRGRVNSTWSMVTMAAQPIGMVLVAWLLGWAGIETALIVMGSGMALAGFAGLAFRSVRETEMPGFSEG